MRKPFKFKAVLSRTTTDMMKSKLRSVDLVELVLDCYMKPEEFARLINDHFEKELTIEIR